MKLEYDDASAFHTKLPAESNDDASNTNLLPNVLLNGHLGNVCQSLDEL